MSISAESSAVSRHPPLVSRLSQMSLEIATTPFARTRKLSRNMSNVNSAAVGSLGSPTSPTEPPNVPYPGGRKLSRGTSGQPPPLSRKSSQLFATPGKNGSPAVKPGHGGGAVVTSPTETVGSKSTLATLNESRRMNLSDVVIWRRFTRALRQRVEEKKTEKRTFCWLDRSVSSIDGRRRGAPSIQSEPTYRMEPTVRLSQDKCKAVIQEYVERILKDFTYEAQSCGDKSKEMSDVIRENVRSAQLLPPRYKCIVYVVLGEKKEQGVRVSSMSAWDKNTDNFVSVSYQNGSIFCVVTLFAVYME